MAEEVVTYREPVFTHDTAKKAWGEAYWSLSGKAMLDWVISGKKKVTGLNMQGWYDHRPKMLPIATRNICWCMNISKGEIPKEITDTYSIDIDTYPSWLLPEQYEEYKLKKSWTHIYFKWDSMSIQPQVFNLLLAKLLAFSDYNKIGLVVFDIKDLYVNFNPVEWYKKYHEPYPVEDLDKQKALYEQWLTWSGFKRYYTVETGQLIATPWYYRIPVKDSSFGSSIQEFPEYQLHPLAVTSGTFYPPGLVTKE